MTIKFDENTRGVWYCVLIPDELDFLLGLTRKDGEYEVTYRFRYYNSADPFDGNDRKNWYSFKSNDKNEKEIIDVIRTILSQLLRNNDTNVTEILRGDRVFDKFMDEFLEQDFVHTQRCH